MKTLTQLLTSSSLASVSLASALLVSATLISSVQAEPMSENELYNIIHPDSADIFNVERSPVSKPVGIVSLNDNHNSRSVWSVEFEEYVNPSDFQRAEISSIDDVNQYMGSNPTASGSNQHEVFIYNDVAGEYHLQ